MSLEKSLEMLIERLNVIEEKINELDQKITINSKNCDKMSEHIDFINNVYSNMKTPIEYICDKISWGTKLPQLNNTNE